MAPKRWRIEVEGSSREGSRGFNARLFLVSTCLLEVETGEHTVQQEQLSQVEHPEHELQVHSPMIAVWYLGMRLTSKDLYDMLGLGLGLEVLQNSSVC